MSTQKNWPAYVVAMNDAVTISDDVRNKYVAGSGNGKDAYGYGRGCGASALCFVFSSNLAYNEGRAQSREALTSAMLALCEARLWPGKARDGVGPALASMHNRGYVEHTSGDWRLTPKGETCARLMFADMGIDWPETPHDDVESEAKPKAKTTRKPRGKKVKAPVAAEVNGNDTAATAENGQVAIDDQTPADVVVESEGEHEFSLGDGPSETTSDEQI